jgi:hypothetical protein
MIALFYLTFELTQFVLGQAISKVANTYFDLRRHQDALERAREALRITRATLPPSHPQVTNTQQFIRQIEGVIARLAHVDTKAMTTQLVANLASTSSQSKGCASVPFVIGEE